VTLRILNAGPEPEVVARQLREAIEAALPGSRAEVASGSPGHFELRVESAAFAGKRPVAQHRLVYAAIAHLMAGDAPPVHAIDRLDCRTPGSRG
jgi:stress-induced morphogen